MPIFLFENTNVSVVTYSFKKSAKACGYDPEFMPTLACGFFAAKLSQELLDTPEALFSDEDKNVLSSSIGKPIIWMEESSFHRYEAEEIKAILYHELGHIENNDLDTQVGFEVNQQNEIRADKYAAEIVGKKVLAKALKRTAFIMAERRWGKGPKATNMAKRLIRNSQMAERLEALK